MSSSKVLSDHATRFFVKDEVIYLSGAITEHTRFTVLAKWQKPLKLNLRNITEIKGLGIRRLLEFLRDWGDRPLEYHDCPLDFVSYLADVRGLRGAKSQARIFSQGKRLSNLHAFLAGHKLPPIPEFVPPLPTAGKGHEEQRSDPTTEGPVEEVSAAAQEASPQPAAPSLKLKGKMLPDLKSGEVPPPSTEDVVSSSQIARRIASLAEEDGCRQSDGRLDVRAWLSTLTRGWHLGEQ